MEIFFGKGVHVIRQLNSLQHIPVFLLGLRSVRIASLSPSVTDLLFRLDLGHDIVCRSEGSVYPLEARDIPKAHFDVRRVSEHEPDIVFIDDDDDGRRIAAECQARDVGTFTYAPTSLSEAYDAMRHIATMFEREREATDVIASMQHAFKDVKKRAHVLPRNPKVLVLVDDMRVRGQWVAEVTRTAGGSPLVNADESVRTIDREDVAAFAPDLIVLAFPGADDHKDTWADMADTRVIDPFFLAHPSPRLIEGARYIYGWLFEQLH